MRQSIESLPNVSCLLPTRHRWLMLQKSIACACWQTYPHKELVIASDGSDGYKPQIAEHGYGLGRHDIRCVFVDGNTWNLGQMRHLTVDHAQGHLLCQWDDDDLF